MTERRTEFTPILLFVIAIFAAFLVYDRVAGGQREAVTERQRDFETRTVAQVKQLDNQAEQQRQQADTALRAHELELKKLELEIKRAEADEAQAQLKRRELETVAAEKKRTDAVAELKEEAAERARLDAETAREEARREDARKKSAAVRAAQLERVDASRRLNELEWKKQTAQRAVIAWRNKLGAAEHSKEKAAIDLINAQNQANGHAAAAQPPQRGRSDPLAGLDGGGPDRAGDSNDANAGKRSSSGGGATVSWAYSQQEAVNAAQDQQAGSEKAIATYRAELQRAQAELTRLTTDYESALGAKQAADRRLSLVAPAPQQNRVFATYSMLDGRKLEALCVIEAGDDIWIKTGSGIQTIKRTDIEEITRAEDGAAEK